MKNFWLKLEDLLKLILLKPVGILEWAISFLGIIVIRLFLDNFIAKRQEISIGTIMDLHNLLFFLIMMLLVWLFLSFLMKESPLKLANLIIFASLFLIFPPIFDILKTGSGVFWSFYLISDIKTLFSQFITIFGHLPSGIVYFGTKIVFISSIILCCGVVFLKTKSFLKAFLSLFGVYFILFFMGAFPSFFAYIFYFFEGKRRLQDISSVHIIQLFANPAKIFNLESPILRDTLAYNLNLIYFLVLCLILFWLFFLSDKPKMKAFWGNLRIPQVFYHWGLFVIGVCLGFLTYPQDIDINVFAIFAFFSLILAIFLAWEASVVANDIFDLRVDSISNSKRPLLEGVFEKNQYKEFGIILFLLSLIGGLVVGLKFFYFLLVYQILAYFYSCSPFRLKRFPIIATLISGSASLVVLMMGFSLFSGSQNIADFSWRIIVLLLVAFTLSLPIKDFKDIEGDKEDGIWTIPVIFGEEKGRLIVASGIFLSFMLSVFLLNEPKLFYWALLFGAIAFFVINNKKIKPRSFFWWIFGIVFVYGLILVKVIFF